MQDVQQLSPLEVGVRQLPQAVTGLMVSPIIGCWTHKIDNMVIIVAAALGQAGAGALLLSLQPDSNYFAFIFPSLILSALGMDWARNVVAVSRLAFIQPLPSFCLNSKISVTFREDEARRVSGVRRGLHNHFIIVVATPLSLRCT